ncbi:MAG: 2-C-methyl-D-erythritol 2,4-cyclodiphosphate synthase, partial [Carnobacterium sp.]
ATIIAEAPKMQTYLEEMKQNIAADCEADSNQINLKATTSEKMGFVGRKEGIAVMAVCLLGKK